MAIPSVITQGTNTVNIGLFGINKPELLNKLVNRFGDQGLDYFMYLKSLGWVRPTGQETFGHFEDDWLHQTWTVGAPAGSPGAGNPQTYVLDPSSINAANGLYYPQVNDTVLFSGGGGEVGSISAITGTFPAPVSITIAPKSPTMNFPALLAGDVLVINGNNQSEGADGATRRSIFDNLFQYQNTLQIVYTKYDVTGSQMANGATYIPGDTNGQNYVADYMRGMFNAEYRHSLNISMTLLTGQQNTNLLPDPFNPGTLLTGTEGLLPYMRRTANPYPYAAGTLSLSDDDAIARILEAEFAGKYIIRFMGRDLDIETENYLTGFLTPTQTSPAIVEEVASERFKGDKALAMSLDFTYFKKGGYMHMLKPLKILNHPQLLGAAGYEGHTLGILIPMDEKRVKIDGVDTQVPSIGCRYKEFAGYNRMAEILEVGGANKVKTNLVDSNSKLWRSHFGAHHSGGNKMILMHT